MSYRRWAGMILTALVVVAIRLPAEDDKLPQINRRILEIEERLNTLKSERSTILNEIYKVELQAEIVVIEANKLDSQLREIEKKVAVKMAEKSLLEKRIEQSRDNIRRVLRIMYKTGSNGYAQILMSMKSIDQLFHSYRLMSLLIDQKLSEINTVKVDMNQLELVNRELQGKRNELLAVKDDRARKLGQLRILKTDKLHVIERIGRERGMHLQLLDELKNEAERLTSMIDQKSQAIPDQPGVDTALVRGKLAWPLRGIVISQFGKQKSHRFNTYTINNGIEIRPTQSDEIHVVFDGEVVFSDYYPGYGNLVIVQHSRSFHTLYGHCEKFLKQKGDRVARGDIVAVAGDSGAGANTGKSLYFEVRENLKAEDPLKWLGKR
jgi:murein hydrolase activator